MVLWPWSLTRSLPPAAQLGFAALAILAMVQLAIGINTLLLVVPVTLCAMHQAGAVLVRTATLWSLYPFRARQLAPKRLPHCRTSRTPSRCCKMGTAR